MRAGCRLLAVLSIFGTATTLHAAPADDLGSPSQETRDAASRTLRETYRPSSREHWDRVVAGLHMGDRKEQILAQLEPYHPKPGFSMAGGGAYSENYQLDDLWSLRCDYAQKDDRLFSCELSRFARRGWVDPPKRFTGAWVTYFANGQKSSEREYADGQVVGDDISFDEEGRRIMMQRHDPDDNTHIEETGYYPSGRISRHGEYRGTNHRSYSTGTWKEYYEDGRVKSERTFEDTGMNGTFTEYNENGSVKSRKVYKDGIVNTR